MNQSESLVENEAWVNNEQILRCGVVISPNKFFDKQTADSFGRLLHDNAEGFQSSVFETLRANGATNIQITTMPVAITGKNVPMFLQSFRFEANERLYDVEITRLVSTDNNDSTLWAKVTHYEDGGNFSPNLAQQLLDVTHLYCEEQAKRIDPGLKFNKGFQFHILGAHSTDYAILDAYTILSRNRGTKAAFDDLVRKKKLNPLRRLLQYAHIEDAFSLTQRKLLGQWRRLNSKNDGLVSSIVPFSADGSPGLVLAQISQSDDKLRAWVLCHEETIDWEGAPRASVAQRTASNFTLRLAQALAA